MTTIVSEREGRALAEFCGVSVQDVCELAFGEEN